MLADLTDADVSLEFTIAAAVGASALISKDLDDGITGTADGEYVIAVGPSDLSALTRDAAYRYSLVLTESSGQPQTVAWGTFTARGRV